MTEICTVVITAPDAEWLADFVHHLVNDRLCASGHIITPIRSVYRWRGEVYDKPEAHVTLHTRTDRVPEIISRTNDQHPYEVPCIITTAITDASPEYAAWVIAETSPSPTHPE